MHVEDFSSQTCKSVQKMPGRTLSDFGCSGSQPPESEGLSESSLASPWSDRVTNPTLWWVSDLCTAGISSRVGHSKRNLYLKKAHFSLLDAVFRASVQSTDWTQPVMGGDKMLQIPAWESCYKKLVSASDPFLSLCWWKEMVQADCSRNTLLMGTDSSLTPFPKQYP